MNLKGMGAKNAIPIAGGRSKKLRIWLSWSKFFGFSTYLNRLSCKPWIKDSVLLDLLNFPKFYSNFLSFTPTFLSFTPTFLSFTPTFLSFTYKCRVNILGKNLGRSKDKIFRTHALQRQGWIYSIIRIETYYLFWIFRFVLDFCFMYFVWSILYPVFFFFNHLTAVIWALIARNKRRI